MSKQIYIVLRMRGEPYYGFPVADKARDRLLGLGLKPVSPADLDRANGFDPFDTFMFKTKEGSADLFDWNYLPPNFDLQAAIERDNKVIDDPETEAIYVVHERISESTGGMAEIERAMKRGKIVLFDTMSDDDILHALWLAKPPVSLTTFVAGQFAANEKAREAILAAAGKKGVEDYLKPLQPVGQRDGRVTVDHSPLADKIGEIRYTDPLTGGQKGDKLARHDLLPPDIVHELAEHYGKGARKYADRNMEKGYPWSKSYAACHRHLNAFWRGEDVDEETGSLHLISAAWHCFTLAWFIRHGKGTDDRPKTE